MRIATDRRAETDQPIYWFAILDQAIEEGDWELAARAIGELRRMGIEVTYRLHGARRA